MTMENEEISNRDLAVRVGVHESVTSRWRSGRSTPSTENCERLAAALGVDFLRLAVTAGLMNSKSVGADPLPIPEPVAVRARIRHQLQQIKGLTRDGVEAALRAWDEEIAVNDGGGRS
jgi:transcriptional regulator with XRE-family HTH domain